MEPWFVECARCKRIVHGSWSHLMWSPALGSFRLCRKCRRELVAQGTAR